ncbi:MAG: NUDIX domain-containing protein [Nanoarchaeota archaeon]|nr:NUDIX domain-containing protein [Nanoarchaeota archaeon]
MEKGSVILAYVRFQGKLLLMKRSAISRSFPHLWSIVTGHIELGDGDSLLAAVREIYEETGITPDRLQLVKRLAPFKAKMSDRTRIVHPFLFDALTNDVRLNDEHAGFAWIDHSELDNYHCVEGLDLVWKRLHEKS